MSALGAKKASLAAIRDGHGGQQKRQQSSLKDKPFIFSVLLSLHQLQNITNRCIHTRPPCV